MRLPQALGILMQMNTTSLETPVGPLSISEDNGAIVSVGWTWEGESQSLLLDQAVEQLQAYFAKELSAFDLPLSVSGSKFQQDVCTEMLKIPLGETRTYGDIAKALSCAAQPVGNACGGNPIPVIIPCHRVMGAGGRLTGFSGLGGVDTKVALLIHEGAAGLLI